MRRIKKAMNLLHSSKQLLLLAIIVSVTSFYYAKAEQPLPNCPTNCGSVIIPFPFGTTKDCSLDSTFLINCNQTTSLPRPFLSHSNQSIISISLNGELRVEWPVASDCYAEKGKRINQTFRNINMTHFHVSSSQNKLIAIGCDTVGAFTAIDSDGKNYTTACVALCNRFDDIDANGTCSGTGCCEISIPQGNHHLSEVGYVSGAIFNNHSTVHAFNPCGYAFLVEDGGYSFVSTDIDELEKKEFPVVLDWAVGNQTCKQAKKEVLSYACKAESSECYDSAERSGYLCRCSSGFQGNPYLLHGCQDINECMESNECVDGATCINLIGSYNCSCPRNHDGDAKKDGTRCSPKSSKDIIMIIALSVSVSAIALLAGSFYTYWTLKKRKLSKLKEQFFQQNGGLLLQQQIARHRGSTEATKVFTMEELKEATNNFDEGNILGQGGQGTVYKGVLRDHRTVAIKKSKISDPNQIEPFINEVIVLSQINHRNVVKLLGCCLETEFPLLVYEFILNGTIYEHLHDQSQSLKLTWKTRLRIATETAGALAYLHSAASTPIIHRDVKTTNILLDHNLIAKVSDFGASRIFPLDRNQLTTLVQGTLGYLDPEYFHTSQLTEKSDVYSFGVVLAELLTGKKALSFARPEGDRNLAVYFVSSMKKDQLLHVMDTRITGDDANVEHISKFANIVVRCLRVKGEERPTMKEVAIELEGILVMEKKHQWENSNLPSEETGNLLTTTPSNFYDGGNDINSSGLNSVNQMSMSLIGGR